MRTIERYFLGGFDPNHPNGNVQFLLEDNEDGTGILYEYDTDGEIIAQTNMALPLPDPVTPPTVLVNAEVVTGFASSVLDAQTLEEIRGAAAALLTALEAGDAN